MGDLYDAARRQLAATSPELFQQALDRSLDAVTILQSVRDSSGAIVDFTWVYVNNQAAAVLQRPVSALLGQRLLDVLPGNRSNLFPRYCEVVTTAIPQEGEIAYDADGITGWFRNMVVRLGDGVAIFFRDVTAEKRTAEALRVSEERRRLAVAAASLGDWYLNPVTKAFELSTHCKAHFGLPPDAQVDDTLLLSTLHPEDRALAENQLRTAVTQGGEFTTTLRVIWPDASLHWITIRGRSIAERLNELVGVTVDVTEAVWAERTQRLLAEAGRVMAETQGYETILAAMVPLAIPDLADYCMLYLSDEHDNVERTVVAHRDPQGLALLQELARRYPFDPGGDAPVAQVLRRGRKQAWAALSPADLDAMSRDSGQRALLESLQTKAFLVVPLITNGRQIGALLFAVTTSSRRYGSREQEVAQVLVERISLAIAHARLYESARAAYAAAEQALHQRDELLSYVVHDMKNPLTAILGQLQMLQHRLANPAGFDLERVKRGLRTAETAANNLHVLLNELQDLAQLQAGKVLHLNLHMVDLVVLIQRAISVRQATTLKHTLQLETHLPQLLCQCDAVRIERVIANLLANAIKYSPDGGRVHVALEHTIDADTAWAVIRITDQGFGIPPQDLPHIFDHFYRGSNVGAVSGTGLGLASVAAIVSQHGGRISANSDLDRGTTFTLKLPCIHSPS